MKLAGRLDSVEHTAGGGWPLAALGQLAALDRRIINSGDPTAAGLRYLGLENVEPSTGRVLEFSAKEASGELDGVGSTFYFDERHVLYGKLRPYLNKVVLPSGPGRCSTELIPLLPTGSVDREFLAFALRRPQSVAFALKGVTGSRMPRADMDSLMTLSIPLPPIAEQKRIVLKLRRQLEAARVAQAAAEERIRLLQGLRSALYREAFGNQPRFGASALLPSSEAKGWNWHRLTDIARLATGHTPSRSRTDFWEGNIPWLQLADIRALDGTVATQTSEHTSELGIANSAAVLLPEGTICMSRTASVGFVTMLGRPMATSQDFVNWVCGPGLDPLFLLQLLIAHRSEIQALGTGAVHSTIYFPTVRLFSVCVPPVEDQRRIATRLSGRLRAIELAEGEATSELSLVQALPATLLRRALSDAV